MASIFINPFVDVGSGVKPADGAKLFFFALDVVTPKDTFTTEAASVAHSNPVIANAKGVFDEIWIEGSYVAVLKDKNDAQQWQSQPFTSAISNADLSITKATIAAAKADDDLQIGQTVFTQGYTVSGGIGGAEYLVTANQAVDGFGDHLKANGDVLLLQIKNNEFIVSQFGGVDNIGTDIHANVFAADAAAALTNGTVFWDVAQCRLDSSFRVSEGVTHDPAGDCEIVTNDAFDDAIIIGKIDKTANHESKWLSGFELRRLSREWDTGVDNSSIGITLLNCINCEVHVETERYNIGVRLFGDNGGCSFNNVLIDTINDCRFGIDLADETGASTGFVTSNKIAGAGEITYRSSTVSAANGNNIVMRNINVSNNGFANNNNVFDSFGMKLNNSIEVNNYNALSAFVVDNGQQNDYRSLRWEEFGADTAFHADQWVIWGSQSTQNRISGGRVLLEPHIADKILDNSSGIHSHKLIGFDVREVSAFLTSAEVITTSTFTFIDWDDVSDGNVIQKWWDAGTPERMTVPKNVKRIEIKAQVSWQSVVTAGRRVVQIFRNTTVDTEAPIIQGDSKDIRCQLAIVELDVVEGDYFRVRVQQQTGSDLDLLISPITKIDIRVIE